MMKRYSDYERVFSCEFGWGLVIDSECELHSTEVIRVRFNKKEEDKFFNRDGRRSSTDFYPSLFKIDEAERLGLHVPIEKVEISKLDLLKVWSRVSGRVNYVEFSDICKELGL